MKDPAQTNTAKRANLGRGLAALFGEESPQAPADGSTPRTLPVEALQPGRLQPRTVFTEEALEALTESVRAQGILQPLIVRPLPAQAGRYEIVAGERRWRAAQRARLHDVPVIVRELTDAQALELALVENVQRQDLDALEEAEGYRRLIEEFQHRQEDLARLIGKSRSHIANTLRLLQLTPGVKALLQKGELSAGHARALLGTPDRDFQADLAKRIVRDRLSVREAEDAVRVHTHGDETEDDEPTAAPAPASSPSPRTPKPLPEPGFLELEQLLSDHLDTRVSISSGAGTGKLVVQFADLADLERIYKAMVGA